MGDDQSMTTRLQRWWRARDPQAHQPVLPDRPDGAWWARRLGDPELVARAERVPLVDEGHGFDAFGMSREGVAFALALTSGLYARWFRVTAHHPERIPATGPLVMAANHSGTLPLDGMMIWNDVVRHTEPPRVPRVVVDYFATRLPWVSPLFVRAGAFAGTRGNFHALLERGEALLVFPEGVRGIGKPFSQRYQLQRWTHGHVELAIRHGAPVLPVAVVGAEEQLPQVAKLPTFGAFGTPYLPVPASPVPLPVHHHIWYGEPIPVHRDHPPSASHDPAVLEEAAGRVKEAVAALLREGLAHRTGVFA